MRIWAFFIILAFVFLAMVLVIPLKYKEQLIGEKLIQTNNTTTKELVFYKYSTENILLTKEYYKVTLLENYTVKFKKVLTERKIIELYADIFDSSKRCFETNCEYKVLEGTVVKEDNKICVPIPKNPFQRNYAKVEILCYSYEKPALKFYLDLGGYITLNIQSDINSCYLKIGNQMYYLSPCSKELNTFLEKAEIELIPESEGTIKELSIKTKLIGGKYYRFFSVDEGKYRIIIAVQTGKIKVLLDNVFLGETDGVLSKEVMLSSGTHVIEIIPESEMVFIRKIVIEKI